MDAILGLESSASHQSSNDGPDAAAAVDQPGGGGGSRTVPWVEPPPPPPDLPNDGEIEAEEKKHSSGIAGAAIDDGADAADLATNPLSGEAEVTTAAAATNNGKGTSAGFIGMDDGSKEKEAQEQSLLGVLDVEMGVRTNITHTSKGPSTAPFYSEAAASKKSVTSATTTATQQPPQQMSIYGRPLNVSDSGGTFPNAGSVLGPYFCLGQLGKGTFSSIHKCINMQYYHTECSSSSSSSNNNGTNNNSSNCDTAAPDDAVATSSSHGGSSRRRIAAAKVELGSFQQSGVLEAEATILDFLHRKVPAGTVPVYMGHFRSDKFAAILMEFLPGEDMHQLRERVMASSSSSPPAAADSAPQQQSTRRVSAADAVYFCADVMLPLLQRMHQVGVVHRDVKPSNCVRKGNVSKEFCLVDFGLSKSIVVPQDSELADQERPWAPEREWLKPLHCKSRAACFRKERPKADFRGTSMYASLRVHQGKDYCPRDDVWSLLYVFCDLVSGGLPWMSHAANRDRGACQRVKEWVHGGEGGKSDSADRTADLLRGDAYHVAKYRRDRQKEAKVESAKLSPVPEPLALSLEELKVIQLRQAFTHVAQLQFWETPDYALIQRCIRSFGKGMNFVDPVIVPMTWSPPQEYPMSPDHQTPGRGAMVPEWHLADYHEPLDDNIFDDAELAAKALHSSENFESRIPIEMRYRLAQMDCNLAAAGNVPPQWALQDWMNVVLPLLYNEWDSRKYEDGGHRTTTDGYKRLRYLELLRKCDSYAKAFHSFQSHACFFDGGVAALDSSRSVKRRKIHVQLGAEISSTSGMILLSKALVGLQLAIKAETAKKAPPPVRISFS